MIVGGVDIGAATAKAVILREGENREFAYAIMDTGDNVRLAAEEVLKRALEKAGLAMEDLNGIFSTGYGRRAAAFSHKAVSEIICHGKGAHYLMPRARTIIDIGGQDSKVMNVDEGGIVTNFSMNDKCAAGTGRFLEVMARVLKVGHVGNMGPMSLKSGNPCKISSTCTVFAESEVVALRGEGAAPEDLIAGIHKAVVARVVIMGRRVGFKPDMVFTGGVAKNVGAKRALEEETGMDFSVPDEPQIVGALGAALLAREEKAKAIS